LRANRRASWLHHVDSRLDDMATTARGLDRRRRGEAPATARGDGGGATAAGRNCWEEARARRLYDAAASYSGAGGGIDRRRWNRAVAARGKIEGASAGRGGGRNFSRCVFVRVRRDAARCSRVTFCAPDSANRHAPEGRFRLHVLYTGDFFSACAL
jgi:hypothetical protein